MPFLSHGTKTHYCRKPRALARRKYGVNPGARWYCPECGLIYAWQFGYDNSGWGSTGKFHEEDS